MIPKTIHYCWFGRGEKPELFKKCIQSWKRYAPDFEITEWNEDNFDISKLPFAKEAYDCKKYAFVSDVARLSVIYEYGGVYLDTDVELISEIDCFLKNGAFLFFQNATQINTGMGFGAERKHPIVAAMLKEYQNKNFDIEKMSSLTCTILNTKALTLETPNFNANNTTQKIENTYYYSSQLYDSYAIHYGQFSWMNEEQRKALRYARKTPPNRKMLARFRSPGVVDWFDRHQIQKAKKLYLFMVYDFVEYGAVYWGYKIIQRIRRKIIDND